MQQIEETEQNEPIKRKLSLLAKCLLFLGAIAICFSLFTGIQWIRVILMLKDQVNTGHRVLKSIKSSDLSTWARRSEQLLIENPNVEDPIAVYFIRGKAKPIPEELKALKIIRIDIYKNKVYYCWIGGFDHISLIAEKTESNGWHFTAEYSDEEQQDLGDYIP